MSPVLTDSRIGSKKKEWTMIAMKEKVTFERFTLGSYITLPTWELKLVRVDQCPFNSCSAVPVKNGEQEGSFCHKQCCNSRIAKFTMGRFVWITSVFLAREISYICFENVL